MNKPSKCKNCQWYGKPYWSIINPCDSCPNDNDYKTIITIDREPLFKEALTEEEIKKAMTDKSIFQITLEEKDKEIERLNNIIERIDSKLCSTWQLYYDHSRLTPFKCEDMLDLIEQIRKDIKELKEGK